jgi:hypothetical protein
MRALRWFFFAMLLSGCVENSSARTDVDWRYAPTYRGTIKVVHCGRVEAGWRVCN